MRCKHPPNLILLQDVKTFGMISMGIAAVGASATAGLTATDVQRLQMVTSGMGPSAHPVAPLPEAAGGSGEPDDATPAEGAKEEAAEEDGEPGADAAAEDTMEGVEAAAEAGAMEE